MDARNYEIKNKNLHLVKADNCDFSKIREQLDGIVHSYFSI